MWQNIFQILIMSFSYEKISLQWVGNLDEIKLFPSPSLHSSFLSFIPSSFLFGFGFGEDCPLLGKIMLLLQGKSHTASLPLDHLERIKAVLSVFLQDFGNDARVFLAQCQSLVAYFLLDHSEGPCCPQFYIPTQSSTQCLAQSWSFMNGELLFFWWCNAFQKM